MLGISVEASYGLQQGQLFEMRALPLALFCLVSTGLAATAPRADILTALTTDAWLLIFARLGFAGIFQASQVSKGFHKLASKAVVALYGIQHDGKGYLNYTKVLYDFDTLVQSTAQDATVAEANAILKASAHFTCIQAVLQARFGYSIRFAEGCLPEFFLKEVYFDILEDVQRVSVLPYVLDQQRVRQSQWAFFIAGLAERGQFDLLNQLTFAKIDENYFYELMSIPLPESVIMTAAKSLQRSHPTSGLSELLAWAVFGSQAAVLPEKCGIPLLFLRYLHENSMAVPAGCTFIYGLDRSSIGFWLFLIGREEAAFNELLELILKHGDSQTRRLAIAFYESVPLKSDVDCSEDFTYQEMLIRFRFSPVCNEHIVQNYNAMLGSLLATSYHVACAFLTCKQFSLVDSCALADFCSVASEALINRMMRVEEEEVNRLLRKCTGCWKSAPSLLKRLIRRKAGGAQVQLVWDSVQARQLCTLDHSSCSVPIAILEDLAFEQGFSVDVERVLLMLDSFQWYDERISREARVLYTAMFWEASEKIILHFLDLLPIDYMLKRKPVVRLLRLTKYSDEFCKLLIRRTRIGTSGIWKAALEFRPKLAMELDQYD